ncbi:hypothetical protein [Winogradskyella sediminis]|uniref:Uncharacterized protein n=1 Tax=Winogradskyella sediminis TaxID=1382466 RepID=A0A1H1X6U5_9FLAO|nr:hypothetical protein [Winogradskyella sediminis]SDT05024.1 hypothetical protein SAMN04489797_3119 [Winogradskyella sediminis]
MTIKKISTVLNWIGGLSAIWLFAYPKFYNLSVLINILIPIIGILFALKHQGKVGIDYKKWDNTPIPKIDSAILFPSFALILRALMDFKIIGFKNIFIYALIISVPLIIVLFYGTKEYLIGKKIFFGIVWAILFTFTFGCGTAILTNALLDKSKPEFYKAKIINKEIEKGKTTAYRIDFEPWGPILENDLMRVSKKEFDRLNVNDSIELKLRKGFLKTQWIIKK